MERVLAVALRRLLAGWVAPGDVAPTLAPGGGVLCTRLPLLPSKLAAVLPPTAAVQLTSAVLEDVFIALPLLGGSVGSSGAAYAGSEAAADGSGGGAAAVRIGGIHVAVRPGNTAAAASASSGDGDSRSSTTAAPATPAVAGRVRGGSVVGGAGGGDTGAADGTTAAVVATLAQLLATLSDASGIEVGSVEVVICDGTPAAAPAARLQMTGLSARLDGSSSGSVDSRGGAVLLRMAHAACFIVGPDGSEAPMLFLSAPEPAGAAAAGEGRPAAAAAAALEVRIQLPPPAAAGGVPPPDGTPAPPASCVTVTAAVGAVRGVLHVDWLPLYRALAAAYTSPPPAPGGATGGAGAADGVGDGGAAGSVTEAAPLAADAAIAASTPLPAPPAAPMPGNSLGDRSMRLLDRWFASAAAYLGGNEGEAAAAARTSPRSPTTPPALPSATPPDAAGGLVIDDGLAATLAADSSTGSSPGHGLAAAAAALVVSMHNSMTSSRTAAPAARAASLVVRVTVAHARLAIALARPGLAPQQECVLRVDQLAGEAAWRGEVGGVPDVTVEGTCYGCELALGDERLISIVDVRVSSSTRAPARLAVRVGVVAVGANSGVVTALLPSIRALTAATPPPPMIVDDPQLLPLPSQPSQPSQPMQRVEVDVGRGVVTWRCRDDGACVMVRDVHFRTTLPPSADPGARRGALYAGVGDALPRFDAAAPVTSLTIGGIALACGSVAGSGGTAPAAATCLLDAPPSWHAALRAGAVMSGGGGEGEALAMTTEATTTMVDVPALTLLLPPREARCIVACATDLVAAISTAFPAAPPPTPAVASRNGGGGSSNSVVEVTLRRVGVWAAASPDGPPLVSASDLQVRTDTETSELTAGGGMHSVARRTVAVSCTSAAVALPAVDPPLLQVTTFALTLASADVAAAAAGGSDLVPVMRATQVTAASVAVHVHASTTLPAIAALLESGYGDLVHQVAAPAPVPPPPPPPPPAAMVGARTSALVVAVDSWSAVLAGAAPAQEWAVSALNTRLQHSATDGGAPLLTAAVGNVTAECRRVTTGGGAPVATLTVVGPECGHKGAPRGRAGTTTCVAAGSITVVADASVAPALAALTAAVAKLQVDADRVVTAAGTSAASSLAVPTTPAPPPHLHIAMLPGYSLTRPPLPSPPPLPPVVVDWRPPSRSPVPLAERSGGSGSGSSSSGSSLTIAAAMRRARRTTSASTTNAAGGSAVDEAVVDAVAHSPAGSLPSWAAGCGAEAAQARYDSVVDSVHAALPGWDGGFGGSGRVGGNDWSVAAGASDDTDGAHEVAAHVAAVRLTLHLGPALEVAYGVGGSVAGEASGVTVFSLSRATPLPALHGWAPMSRLHLDAASVTLVDAVAAAPVNEAGERVAGAPLDAAGAEVHLLLPAAVSRWDSASGGRGGAAGLLDVATATATALLRTASGSNAPPGGSAGGGGGGGGDDAASNRGMLSFMVELGATPQRVGPAPPDVEATVLLRCRPARIHARGRLLDAAAALAEYWSTTATTPGAAAATPAPPLPPPPPPPPPEGAPLHVRWVQLYPTHLTVDFEPEGRAARYTTARAGGASSGGGGGSSAAVQLIPLRALRITTPPLVVAQAGTPAEAAAALLELAVAAATRRNLPDAIAGVPTAVLPGVAALASGAYDTLTALAKGATEALAGRGGEAWASLSPALSAWAARARELVAAAAAGAEDLGGDAAFAAAVLALAVVTWMRQVVAAWWPLPGPAPALALAAPPPAAAPARGGRGSRRAAARDIDDDWVMLQL